MCHLCLCDCGYGDECGAGNIERYAVIRRSNGVAQCRADDGKDLRESGLLRTSESVRHCGLL